MKKATLVLALLFGVFLFVKVTPVSVSAKGSTGDCSWRIDGDTLTISGTGSMADYRDTSPAPWHEKRRSVRRIVVKEGVTYVGASAFWTMYSAVELILPDSLKEFQNDAFWIENARGIYGEG